MRREWVLTKAVKHYDKNLFVKKGDDGKLHLIRNGKRFASFEFDGQNYTYTINDPQSVLTLSSDWTPKAPAADWGIEPLMARIREIDGYRSDELLERVNKTYELMSELQESRRNSDFESRAYAAHDGFKRAFKDYNVSSMDQTDPRKKLEKKGII